MHSDDMYFNYVFVKLSHCFEAMPEHYYSIYIYSVERSKIRSLRHFERKTILENDRGNGRNHRINKLPAMSTFLS